MKACESRIVVKLNEKQYWYCNQMHDTYIFFFKVTSLKNLQVTHISLFQQFIHGFCYQQRFAQHFTLQAVIIKALLFFKSLPSTCILTFLLFAYAKHEIKSIPYLFARKAFYCSWCDNTAQPAKNSDDLGRKFGLLIFNSSGVKAKSKRRTHVAT